MTIQTGDKIPACTLKTMGEEGPTDITTDEIFSGKKVVLFAVPGAFTPGCSQTHLPGYVANADKMLAKGDLGGLMRELEKAAAGDKERRIAIRADADTPHRYVVRAMDAASQLGLLRIAIPTKVIKAE